MSSKLPRCEHKTESGRQCRYSVVSKYLTFCKFHQPAPPRVNLMAGLRDLHRSEHLIAYLSRLTIAVSRNQIPPKQATSLAYLSTALMQAIRQRDREHESHKLKGYYDPLYSDWKVPVPGRAPFVNIHDARAFYAQEFADICRATSMMILESQNKTSPHAPYPQNENIIETILGSPFKSLQEIEESGVLDEEDDEEEFFPPPPSWKNTLESEPTS